MGLACVSGVFSTEGLSYDESDDGKITPAFRGVEGWDAVKAFFDLDHSQAVQLFAEHSYAITAGPAAAQAVAARIRQMIARSTALTDEPQ